MDKNKIIFFSLFISTPLMAQNMDYKQRNDAIKEIMGKQYQMWPDSSGSTKDIKRYLTCTKPKPADMTDREYVLRYDYNVDVVLSLSTAKVTLPKKNHENFLYFPEYLFTSKGIDIYETSWGSGAFFVDTSKTLRILNFDFSSSTVRSVDSYKCEDPGVVKLIKMKAREAVND